MELEPLIEPTRLSIRLYAPFGPQLEAEAARQDRPLATVAAKLIISQLALIAKSDEQGNLSTSSTPNDSPEAHEAPFEDLPASVPKTIPCAKAVVKPTIVAGADTCAQVALLSVTAPNLALALSPTARVPILDRAGNLFLALGIVACLWSAAVGFDSLEQDRYDRAKEIADLKAQVEEDQALVEARDIQIRDLQRSVSNIRDNALANTGR